MAEEEKRSSRPRDASGRFVSRERTEETEEQEAAPEQEEAAPQEHDESAQEPGDGKPDRGGDSGVEDISGTPAPSIGPGSVVRREPVEVRLARHEQSDVDAMGQNKRRQVVGKTYGPTLARQAALYGIFLVIFAAIAFGIKVAVDHFDQPPKHFAAEAPWAQKGVKQTAPKPLQ
jgi:hypothetical protein